MVNLSLPAGIAIKDVMLKVLESASSVVYSGGVCGSKLQQLITQRINVTLHQQSVVQTDMKTSFCPDRSKNC